MTSAPTASPTRSVSHRETPAISLDEIKRLPKVLLHDHLDGGLRPSTILELADEIGWTPRLPSTDIVELAAWFRRGAETKDLLQYLATFEHTLAVMQRSQDLERVAFEAVIDLADDGVLYAEVRFAPELHVRGGLSLSAVVEAVQAGFRRGMAGASAAGHFICVNTILCAMRTETRSLEVAQLAVNMRDTDDRIVAFDLAGAETGWMPSLHAEALEFVRNHQMHLTIHASEPPDIELISDALAHGAERIGHGVRLTADIANMTALDRAAGLSATGDLSGAGLGRIARSILERQIPLEMAPTCNVQIGAVANLGAHPVGAFLRAGFRVTVNTDNRLMSDVSVSSEVHAVASTFDLSVPEVCQLTLNGIDSSFGNFTERQSLRADIQRAYASVG
jgi:adenosine deaminase